MAELVDALDLGSSIERCAGSSPVSGTFLEDGLGLVTMNPERCPGLPWNAPLGQGLGLRKEIDDFLKVLAFAELVLKCIDVSHIQRHLERIGMDSPHLYPDIVLRSNLPE